MALLRLGDVKRDWLPSYSPSTAVFLACWGGSLLPGWRLSCGEVHEAGPEWVLHSANSILKALGSVCLPQQLLPGLQAPQTLESSLGTALNQRTQVLGFPAHGNSEVTCLSFSATKFQGYLLCSSSSLTQLGQHREVQPVPASGR